MKKFENPMMMVVKLSNENVLTSSVPGCEQNMCIDYDCPDCPTICTGIYHCDVFKCATY